MSPLVLVALLGAFVGLGTMFGFLRAGIALLMAWAIGSFGVRQMRGMLAAPPEPDVTDVSDYGLRYVCSMCGLQLKVEVAARDKPPSHCMEPMVLERAGGKPPLRPID